MDYNLLGIVTMAQHTHAKQVMVSESVLWAALATDLAPTLTKLFLDPPHAPLTFHHGLWRCHRRPRLHTIKIRVLSVWAILGNFAPAPFPLPRRWIRFPFSAFPCLRACLSHPLSRHHRSPARHHSISHSHQLSASIGLPDSFRFLLLNTALTILCLYHLLPLIFFRCTHHYPPPSHRHASGEIVRTCRDQTR